VEWFNPDRVFAIGNGLAVLGWAGLALSPPQRRWSATVWRFSGRVLPLVLALAYLALLVRHWGPGGFDSLTAVRQLFDAPGLLAAGWLHYLAFDLFVGTWIVRRAGELGIAHLAVLPCLLLTFLFGPLGLLAFAGLCTLRRQPFFKE
jgi:hypothetical protein